MKLEERNNFDICLCFLHAQTEIQQYFEVIALSHNINCSDFIVKKIY